MPVEIKVGPPVLTINQGTVFMVTDERGEINGSSEQGIFAGDTRLLSHHRLYINGIPWTLLTSATVQYYAVRIELTNPALSTDIGALAAAQVGLTVRRRVAQAIHEDLDLVSFADSRSTFSSRWRCVPTSPTSSKCARTSSRAVATP